MLFFPLDHWSVSYRYNALLPQMLKCVFPKNQDIIMVSVIPLPGVNWITGFKWYLLDFFTVKLILFSIKLSIL